MIKIGQILLEGNIIRLMAAGLFIMRQCFFPISQLVKNYPEIIMGHGVIRVNLQHLFQLDNSLPMPPGIDDSLDVLVHFLWRFHSDFLLFVIFSGVGINPYIVSCR